MKFRKFTKPQFLKSIGRELLGQLFTTFATDMASKNIAMPDAALPDDVYYKSLSNVAMSPDGLPDNMIDTLYAIEEMANVEGQERLENAVTEAGLGLTFAEQSSHGDIAVQVFLASPALLVQTHNEVKLGRLAAFDYFGCPEPEDRSASFIPPTPEVLALLTADLDGWFKEHNRGKQTVHVEIKPMDGEFWFLVRHGDTFARAPKVENGQMSVLHFRPAKDDVVVYSSKRDEIRIHAGTKGEKELYRQTFGERLFGDPENFSDRKTYTLEPLRTDTIDSLDVSDIAGLDKIVLREFELNWKGGFNDSMIRKSDDVFAAAAKRERPAFPDSGIIQRAALDFYFNGQKKPRRVQVRIPNTLKLGRHCDAALVHEWLSLRGFRASESVTSQIPVTANGEALAVA
jgi:hypothetical protein